MPLVILYPVFTVWLGIGSESKIAFALIYGFLPTMLATAAGIQTIDPQLLLAARSMGATLSQRLVRVVIPAAIPTVLSALRVDSAHVFAGVLLVLAMAIAFKAGIKWIDRKAAIWHTGTRGGQRTADDVAALFHQDFPPECVPVSPGEVVRSIEPCVSAIEEGQRS